MRPYRITGSLAVVKIQHGRHCSVENLVLGFIAFERHSPRGFSNAHIRLNSEKNHMGTLETTFWIHLLVTALYKLHSTVNFNFNYSPIEADSHSTGQQFPRVRYREIRFITIFTRDLQWARLWINGICSIHCNLRPDLYNAIHRFSD